MEEFRWSAHPHKRISLSLSSSRPSRRVVLHGALEVRCDDFRFRLGDQKLGLALLRGNPIVSIWKPVLEKVLVRDRC